MAHTIYLTPSKSPCPRCGAQTARLSTFHFGATFEAECAGCGFGRAVGESHDMAVARLHGNYLAAPKKEEGQG